ncbi:MAG: TRAP transporter large permease subunit [Treponema sp.]|nr:TRAP transporter large permease subunit [Candidatus Treponema equi]
MNVEILVAAIAILMYGLVIAFQTKKVWFSLGAALLIIILATIIPDAIFPLPEDIMALEGEFHVHTYALIHSFTEVINWNVILIYLGSMMIASMFIYSKMPAKIADGIINGSGNICFAMAAILAMTGIISIFVENVAAVLVMAPIALAICKKLEMNPTKFLIGLAVMSNLEGTATLIGDPPSMIFANYAKFSFNDFFVHHGKMSIFFIVQAGMLAGFVFFYMCFSKLRRKKVTVETESIVSWVPFGIFVFMVVGLSLMSFFNHRTVYASGILVLGLGIISLLWYRFFQHKSTAETMMVAGKLDWETIFFLIGVFVVVGAVKEAGLLSSLASMLAGVTKGSVAGGFALMILISVAVSAFVDNVPFIIAMLPVASSMASAMETNSELYMFAVLIGSCLGGNVTPFGASANVVATGILKQEGHPVRFSGWLKVGLPFTVVTTLVSAFLLWSVWA